MNDDSKDSAVMEVLWSKYDAIHRFVSSSIPLAFRGLAEADDILQETYAAAWQSADDLAQKENDEIVSWLMTVAKRKLIDRLRTVSSTKRGGGHVEGPQTDSRTMAPSPIRTPSSFVARREAKQILADALNRLPERHQTAIRLRYFEEHSYAEVSGELGISVEAAQMLVKRAVAKLRASIGSRSRLM